MLTEMKEISQDPHVTELLPAYALDCLDDEDAVTVSEHLVTCATCREELLSFQGVADQLALAAPDARPSPDLKRRLKERVQPLRPDVMAVAKPPWWVRLTGVWQRAAPTWGLVSLVLIVALAVTSLALWQQVDESKTTLGEMRFVTLTGTEVAPKATGTIVISVEGDYGTLVVDGLPFLDETQQFQLWLIRDGQRTSGGIFSVNPGGYGSLAIYSHAPLSSYPDFGITIEPAGGSPGPTGNKVLGGSL